VSRIKIADGVSEGKNFVGTTSMTDHRCTATVRWRTEEDVMTQTSGTGDGSGAAGVGAVDRRNVELRYLVLAAQREGNRKLSRDLGAIDLTPAQAEVLLVLSESEPLTLAELGRSMVCEAGSPSRIVETLVRRGLVSRESGRSDRRVVSLSLSPAGRAVLPALLEIDDAITAMTSGRLTETERQVLLDALRKVIKGTTAGLAVARRFGPYE
jgi:DNA-binding MarR family transcriptional regulator